MEKAFKIVACFGAIDAQPLVTEEQYLALRRGDKVIVQLHGEQPEVREFFGYGLRRPLIATAFLGHNYDHVNVIGGHPNNLQTRHHLYEVHKSRIRGIAPKPN